MLFKVLNLNFSWTWSTDVISVQPECDGNVSFILYIYLYIILETFQLKGHMLTL